MRRTTAISLAFLLLLIAATSQVTACSAFVAREFPSSSEKWLASNAGGEDTIHSLVNDNGLLYVEAGGIYGSSILYCLNADTGSQVWNYSIYYLYFTVNKGFVYVAGTPFYNNTGHILCLNASSGVEVWKNNVNARSGEITIAGNSLYVMAGSTVYSFNAKTGVKSWDYSVLTGYKFVSFSVGEGYICTVSVTDKNSNPYFSYIYALNASNGQQLWSQKIFRYTSSVGYACSISIIEGGVFVLQRISLQNSAGSGNVWAFDAQNGTLLWKYGINGAPSDFTVACGAVYCATSSGGVFSLNASNGNEIWRHQENVQFGSIINGNGYLYVSSVKGVSSFKSVSGVKLWDYQANDYNSDPTGGAMVDDLLLTTPTYADEVIYFGWNGPPGWLDTTEHKFYALNAHTGEAIWTDTLSYRFQAAPVVANNTLYLGGSAITTKSPTWVGAGAVIALDLHAMPSEENSEYSLSVLLVMAVIITAILLSAVLINRYKTRNKRK